MYSCTRVKLSEYSVYSASSRSGRWATVSARNLRPNDIILCTPPARRRGKRVHACVCVGEFRGSEMEFRGRGIGRAGENRPWKNNEDGGIYMEIKSEWTPRVAPRRFECCSFAFFSPAICGGALPGKSCTSCTVCNCCSLDWLVKCWWGLSAVVDESIGFLICRSNVRVHVCWIRPRTNNYFTQWWVLQLKLTKAKQYLGYIHYWKKKKIKNKSWKPYKYC